MTKQILKKISSLAIVFIVAISMFVVAGQVFAQTGVGSGMGDTQGIADDGANSVLWRNTETDIQARTALGNDDPRNIAANVINIILGFLGILAVVLILFGGFKWMTAAGNDDKIAEAKKLLVAGVIGLIIILAAFALASFILDAIFRATTDGTTLTPGG